MGQPDRVDLIGDSTVSFTQGELQVELRALTDAELNRQFSAHSGDGPSSTNPYTFGDTRFWEGEKERKRFTTFRIRVTNDGYPKVKIDPSRMVLSADGAEYWSLNLQQLDTYYRAYAIGFRGNEYARYQERLDILRRTLFKNEEIFIGQQVEGYVVFPKLHHSVSAVDLVIHDAVLRFDYRNEPVETVQIECHFEREVGKIYQDGRLDLDPAG
ncbi:MAG TPA: hypothetical protein DIC52_19590 [Candidatus Latescibacteria bacterium]|jgi:hypothetical protein|nr:hypothetical protein [Candidatus Latescibacterota bacterium]|tara:strand:+ start:513 stop:1151 length:639 start_codon:yes stop_codon:yes gene_type:complete